MQSCARYFVLTFCMLLPMTNCGMEEQPKKLVTDGEVQLLLRTTSEQQKRLCRKRFVVSAIFVFLVTGASGAGGYVLHDEKGMLKAEVFSGCASMLASTLFNFACRSSDSPCSSSCSTDSGQMASHVFGSFAGIMSVLVLSFLFMFVS